MPSTTMPDPPRYWFPAKRYGWGWGFPGTWQGRIVLAVYVILIGAAIVVVDPSARPLRFAACLVSLTVILIVVCWAKGEPPRWRFGEREDL